MIELPFIFKLSIIFLITLILSFIFNLIKQPLIIAYIVSGIIAGNYLVGSLETKNILSIFSEIGIAFMLFIVGLELKLKVIKEIGKLSFIIAFLQEFFTILGGFLLAIFLGFKYIEALYIGIALSFSSTIIIIKLLSDKGDLEKFYGKLAVGFLITQDIIAIILLIILPFININQTNLNLNQFLINLPILFISILLIFLLIYLLSKFEKKIYQSNELLFIFSISFLFITASFFELSGLGLEIGALIAGLILANKPLSSEINYRLKPIKNFFLIVFFVYLGFNILTPRTINQIFNIIILSLFIVIIQPILAFLTLKFLKIKNKPAFLFSLISAQISEFSFIIIDLGNKLGQLKNDLLSTISFIGLITIFTSTYMFHYSERIYNIIFKKILKIKDKYDINEITAYKKNFEILLIGCDRTGYGLLLNLKHKKDNILIIEHNYEKFLELKKMNYSVIYADISEVELINELNLKKFQLIISTIPNYEVNLIILREYKKDNSQGIFICNSNKFNDALELYKEGASYVNIPQLTSGEIISDLINKFGFDTEKYEYIKKENFEKIYKIINYLKIYT
ncbi:MAG: membrane protein [Candidatus Parcubacteria bacterium]|nr:MAG: membrane protein [Candidatus Parcubacteria bacterium]